MRGVVVYQGPSRLDGAPIVLVVTLASHNEKTGPMAQAWVLRADMDPQCAIATGQDRSICGDCVHRSGGALERSCYVVTWFGPLNTWKAWQRGRYSAVSPQDAAELIAGAEVRITAYGDPAAVPFRVWSALLAGCAGWTGYTHQWRTCDQRFSRILMASVESEHEADYAHRIGWRTFRARVASEPVRGDEIVCPASAEAGHRLTCQACQLCVGLTRPTARSVTILAHGQRTRWFASRKETAAV